MSPNHKKTTLVLAGIALVYFALMAIVNLRGAENLDRLYEQTDEPVIYQVLQSIFAPGKDWKDTLHHVLVYEDYHYGYPFYALSALVVLPVRLIRGPEFAADYQINLFLLRQFINVLPMILAALTMTWLHTRFESPAKSGALFTFLLCIPGVVRSNIQWWHPDALAVWMVTATLLFLVKDEFRLGKYFWFAAAACGLSAAIKLVGFFFAPAIFVYLLIAWKRNGQSIPRVALAGLVFIVLMSATIVASNPFLAWSDARARMIEIQKEVSYRSANGFETDDAGDIYEKGPATWVPYLRPYYGDVTFLVFCLVACVAGCLWGPQKVLNQLILLWTVPYAVYLLFFVAVKPDHYWLPVMVPFLSTAFNFFNGALPAILSRGTLPIGVQFSSAAVLVAQFSQYSMNNVQRWWNFFNH